MSLKLLTSVNTSIARTTLAPVISYALVYP